MAETNKKVVIAKKDLPINIAEDVITGANIAQHVVRYRIISEDKNVVSAWSLPYKIPAPSYSSIISASESEESEDPIFTYQTSGGTNVGTLIWEAPEVFKDIAQYDIYIRWGTFNSSNNQITYSGGYEYFKTSASGNITILKPTTKSSFDRVSIAIHFATFPKAYVASQVLAQVVDKQF